MRTNMDKKKGCLIGLAIGDALGTTLEFKERDKEPVLTDMVGGGVFKLKPGEWTDDTSMALCLGYALLENDDVHDRQFKVSQLDNYSKWYNTGYCSSNGFCFDIGAGTVKALRNYKMNGAITNNPDYFDSGNGAIMRLAPIPIHYNTNTVDGIKQLLIASMKSTETTHASMLCIQASAYLSLVLNRALNGTHPKSELFKFPGDALDLFGIDIRELRKITDGSYATKYRAEIKSTGFVLDTLEAAMWCIDITDNFKDAVLLAANLGDDADTVAAVTGQIAGALYGLNRIPPEWVDLVTNSDEILELAEKLSN